MGNGTIVVVAAELAECALAFAEALAVSDLPGGVLNVLTGDRDELLGLASRHDDIDGLLLYPHLKEGAVVDAEREAARVMRRIVQAKSAVTPATPIELGKLSEVQTVWMSAYEPRGGAPAY